MVTVAMDTSKRRRRFVHRSNRLWNTKYVRIAALLFALLSFLVALTGVISYFVPTPTLYANPREHRDYECIGWHTTNGLYPFAVPRLWRFFQHFFFRRASIGCRVKIQPDESGYCELRHKKTGKRIRVLPQSYYKGKFHGPRPNPVFACVMALEVMDFPNKVANPPPPNPPLEFEKGGGRGIVMYVQKEYMVPLYTMVHLLRRDYKCTLPIELWLHGGEDPVRESIFDDPLWKAVLEFPNVEYRIHWDPHYQHSGNIAYIIAYTQFEEVLVLNHLSFPTRDPSFLFETSDYQSTGALFWKDLFSPLVKESTISSLLWEILGVPTQSKLRTELEMDAAQMVIHRKKSAKALPTLLFLARSYPQFMEPFHVLQGDLKDLYRIAWHLTDTPLTFVERPPALVHFASRSCSPTLVHSEPTSEEPLFVHWRGDFRDFITQSSLWHHGIYFKGKDANPQQYAVGTKYEGEQALPCYFAKTKSSFEQRPFVDTKVQTLEDRIRKYAKQAAALQNREATDKKPN